MPLPIFPLTPALLGLDLTASAAPLMRDLREGLQPVLSQPWLAQLTDIILLANPLAILPQVIRVFKARDLSGVALPMWCLFAAIQVALVLRGVQNLDASLALSQGLSLIESFIIISVVLIRRRRSSSPVRRRA
jgi:hypothetical protein